MTEINSQGIFYTIKEDYAIASGHEEGITSISISSYINEKPVTTIGANAFYKLRNIQSISIPETVTNMFYRKHFYGQN